VLPSVEARAGLPVIPEVGTPVCCVIAALDAHWLILLPPVALGPNASNLDGCTGAVRDLVRNSTLRDALSAQLCTIILNVGVDKILSWV
jgi:hypothetical protein